MVATALTDSPPTGTVVFSSSSCAARWVACSVLHADSSQSRGQLNRSPRYRIAGLAVRRSAGAASPAMNVVDGTDPGEPRCRYGDPEEVAHRGSPCWRSGRCTRRRRHPRRTPLGPGRPEGRDRDGTDPRWARAPRDARHGRPRAARRRARCNARGGRRWLSPSLRPAITSITASVRYLTTYARRWPTSMRSATR